MPDCLAGFLILAGGNRSLDRALAARFRKKVYCFVKRQNKNLAITIVAAMTGSGNADDRVDRDVQKIVVDCNLQGDFSHHVGLGFHAPINRNFVFALGEFLGIAYRITRDANTGQRFGQSAQAGRLNYGDDDLHWPNDWRNLASVVRQVITEISLMDDPKIRALLAESYPALISQNATITSLGNSGGFSGARLWRIESGGSSYVLRQWPESASGYFSRLRWSHDVLREAYKNGCQFVPVPITASSGESLILRDRSLWQLEPWMPGTADFEKSPTPVRLGNILRALATFHHAVRKIESHVGIPASIGSRIDRMAHWCLHGRFTNAFDELQRHVANHRSLANIGESICQRFRYSAISVQKRLADFRNSSVPIQPVIGDVWHDHVLLTGDEVTGIVDYGAVKMDSVALDLGRLVGSLVGNDPAGWNASIAAYRTICPLSEDEVLISKTLDQSGLALAGLNWLHWICVENRQFGPSDVVFNRIQRIGLRMETMAQKL
jgi:Phosphotransferase enzyme family